MSDNNVNSIIFSPQDRARISQADIQRRREARQAGGLAAGVPMYIDKDDEGKTVDLKDPNDIGFLPGLRGEMISIIARPGNGKTAAMMRWGRARAAHIRRLAAQGDEDAKRRVVVYASWEQPVEELNAFHIAASLSEENRISVTAMAMGVVTDDQMDEVAAINMNAVADPFWVIGHSLEVKRKKPVITMQMLEEALFSIKNWGGREDEFILDTVIIDYLQKIPYGRAESKTIGISDNLRDLKNIFSNVTAFGIVGVQATRDVAQRADPTPTMEDGQWTSSIEQDSDGVIAIMRPCLYAGQAETIGSRSIRVEGYQQMKLAFLKRKLGPAPFERWVKFDVKYNKLIEAEMKYVDLSDYTERE